MTDQSTKMLCQLVVLLVAVYLAVKYSLWWLALIFLLV